VTENEQPNVNQKQGVINKCPSCGGPLKAFVSRCELCGHELAGIGASNTVTELARKFDEIEASLTASGLQGSKLEKELVARKSRVIRDFPIPNAREDLQSLIYYIYPKIQDNKKPDPNAEDWRVKFTEVLNLAKNAYKGDAKTRAEFEEIERSLNVSLAGTLQTRAKRSPLMALTVGGVAILSVIGLASTQLDSWKLKQCEEKYVQGAVLEKTRLEGIVATVKKQLQDNAHAAALTTLNGLQWEYQESACKSDEVAREKAAWENRREDLLAQVRQAEDAVRVQQREQEQRIAEQLRAEEERESAQKRSAAERADAQRIAEAERELTDKVRQRAAARKSAAD
jgi:hypothetical protein